MQGRYCLRAALRNDAAKDMGFSMAATLTGSGIIKMNVTESYNTITGYVCIATETATVSMMNHRDFGLENANITLKKKEVT